MSSIKWTNSQKRAISEHSRDVVVTASAGTGKTAVLAGRCAEIVSDKKVCGDVREILVLTFTNAAADEMRSRIAETLKKVYAATRDKHIRHQVMLLDGADISTIHSFCKRLISEYFYELGIDPAFRTIEDDEARLLKSDVLEKVLEWAWGEDNIRGALEQLLAGRSLKIKDDFGSKIIGLYNFMDGVLWKDKWCKRAEEIASAAGLVDEELGQKQKQIVAERLEEALERVDYSRKVEQMLWGQGLWEEEFNQIEKSIKILIENRWDDCIDGIRNYSKITFSRKPRDIEQEKADTIRAGARKAMDIVLSLNNFAAINPDYSDMVGGKCR